FILHSCFGKNPLCEDTRLDSIFIRRLIYYVIYYTKILHYNYTKRTERRRSEGYKDKNRIGMNNKNPVTAHSLGTGGCDWSLIENNPHGPMEDAPVAFHSSR
ncbi:hypothetical protein V7S82_24275, partial [Enterobacter hormaechei subsp. steigerwaltii]|uniref:hypothetical protein n=1 Tax=Enterobacter hormaechei TaxID=158836 RepID=UPI0032046680